MIQKKEKRTYTPSRGGTYIPVFKGKVRNGADADEVAQTLHLRWTKDEDNEEVCRLNSFMLDTSLKSQARDVGHMIRLAREYRNIGRDAMCELLKISSASYGRYETGKQAMNIETFLQICELLQVMPIELLSQTAPQFWGTSPEDSKINIRLTRLIAGMEFEARKGLLAFLNNTVGQEVPDEVESFTGFDNTDPDGSQDS